MSGRIGWVAVLLSAWLGAGCMEGQLGQYAQVNPAERATVHDACEAKARAKNMDIVNFRGIREIEPGVYQADMVVEHRGQRYDRACHYNARNRTVDIDDTGLASPFPGYGGGGGAGGGGGPGATIAERQRARDACEAKARSDKLDIVSWGSFREVSPDRWEIPLRVRWKGEIYQRTCEYKDRGRAVDIVG